MFKEGKIVIIYDYIYSKWHSSHIPPEKEKLTSSLIKIIKNRHEEIFKRKISLYRSDWSVNDVTSILSETKSSQLKLFKRY